MLKGTNTGRQTDFDGNYTIDASKGQSLIFTYVGFTDQTILVGSATTINVNLEAGATLDEVVITALGISREKNL